MKHTLLLLLLVSGLVQAAGIKKWIDQDGVVHYGDTPPLQVQAEPVSVTRPPSNPGKPLPRLNTDQIAEKGAAQGSAGATPAPKRKFNPKKDAKLICERARKDLEVITRSTRIRLKQADGNERYMTREEIEQRREKSRKLIEKYCK